jgi:hypothetical protein
VDAVVRACIIQNFLYFVYRSGSQVVPGEDAGIVEQLFDFGADAFYHLQIVLFDLLARRQGDGGGLSSRSCWSRSRSRYSLGLSRNIQAFFYGLEGRYMNESAIQTAFLERNDAIYAGVERKIAAHVYVFAGVEAGTALTNDDVTGYYPLAAEQFDAKALTFTVPAVIGTTYTFFVCHDTKMFLN